MLTCKEFLNELSEYLDDSTSDEVRHALEAHRAECPHCWVVCDTTKKTLQIYKGVDPYPIPEDVHTRLMDAIRKKLATH